MQVPPPGFDDLSIEEQIDYVQELWDRIAAKPEIVPVPEWHKKLIDERLKNTVKIRRTHALGARFAIVLRKNFLKIHNEAPTRDSVAGRDRHQRGGGVVRMERAGLGARFLDQLEALLDRIGEHPLQLPQIEMGVHRGSVNRFPYGVYFIPGEKRIVVLAVLHLHRHPDTWKHR